MKEMHGYMNLLSKKYMIMISQNFPAALGGRERVPQNGAEGCGN